MLARATGATRIGVEARVVDVEVDVAPGGTASFRVVGMGSSGGRAMEQRVRAALRNRGLSLPSAPITVNFAPSSLTKEAPPLDLALACALLEACKKVPKDAGRSTLLHGELSLDGIIRAVPGALAAAEAASSAGLARFACARSVASEATAVRPLDVYGLTNLDDLVALLRGEGRTHEPEPEYESDANAGTGGPDLADVRGQLHARRALELAAAGGHGLLFVGPPGAGKSMLARRLPGLLPGLRVDEALAVTRIHSAAGLLLSRGPATGLVKRRPFRAPHHCITPPALIGGGPLLRPGEASLAHHGVLFLDELPEFRRETLETLRQPLEEGSVLVTRAVGRALFPCRFTLIAAMNPCPCGWYGSAKQACTCSDGRVLSYRTRVSGPLLDRLDLQVAVPAISFAELTGTTRAESTAVVAARVALARQRQLDRQGCLNARLTPSSLRKVLDLAEETRDLLRHAMDTLGLSARAHDRVLKLSLSIEDLTAVAGGQDHAPAPTARVRAAAVAEALSYRLLDRGPREGPTSQAGQGMRS